MLTLTEAAKQMIDQLVEKAGDTSAGLRLTHREHPDALTMGLAHGPAEHDEVLEVTAPHAPVFLDPEVLARVDHAVLDAKSEPGAAAFFLREE